MLDDAAKQVVRAVVVLILAAGREIETPLTRQHRHHRFIRADTPVARQCPSEEREPLTNAAGVREQMPDSDVMLVVNPLRNELAHFVVERKLCAAGQQQNAHRRELLRNRGGAKNRRWCNWNA